MFSLPSSDVEATIILRQIFDKLDEISRKSPTIFDEHVFRPAIEISDIAQTEIQIDAFVIKLTAKNADIKVNLDRHITDDEYVIIPQDTGKIMMRLTSKIYAQSLAPGGKLIVEGLKLTGV